MFQNSNAWTAKCFLNKKKVIKKTSINKSTPFKVTAYEEAYSGVIHIQNIGIRTERQAIMKITIILMAKNCMIGLDSHGATVLSTTVAQFMMYIMATTVITRANKRRTIGPGLDDVETSCVK